MSRIGLLLPIPFNAHSNFQVSTVGFGDYSVQTDVGKVICAFFILFATVAFGNALSSVASIPLDRRRERLEKVRRGSASVLFSFFY
eukprot:m.213110 g.213110  ORF g.213110 m.213110 type:complete len:86 (+) comp26166_c0_seq5:38-295(+)